MADNNLLVQRLIFKGRQRWPDGAVVMPNETISVDLTYKEFQAVVTSLQLRDAVRLVVAK